MLFEGGKNAIVHKVGILSSNNPDNNLHSLENFRMHVGSTQDQ